ncbi:MAG: hypothetical protein ABWY46_07040, partial [Pseudomonas sp.]
YFLIIPSKPSADKDSRRHLLAKRERLCDEDKALVAVVTKRLVAPQRVKVSLDELDFSGSTSEKI